MQWQCTTSLRGGFQEQNFNLCGMHFVLLMDRNFYMVNKILLTTFLDLVSEISGVELK